MKLTRNTRGSSRSGRLVSLVFTLVLASSAAIQAQSLVSDTDFFNPDFIARRPGAGGLVALTTNTSFFTPSAQTAGNVTWTHSAGGLVQVGASVPLVGTVDVQLAAYTQTIGNSLVFGRTLDVNTTGLLGGLGATITSLTDQALGASAVNSWNARADVANLNLAQGVLYQASFTVDAGDAINLAALSSANFTLLNGASPIQNIESTTVLNVLNLLNIGSGNTTVDFQFYAPAGLGDLSFNFAATTVADVDLLGTIDDNQNVLTISGFSLAPVPEPGSLALAAVGFMVLLRRRRPCGV